MTKNFLLITGGTGGHVIPAQNFANYLRNKNIDCKIIIDKRGKKYINDFNGKIAGVIDFVGNEITADLALSIVKKGGTIVIVGLYGGSLSISLPLIPMRSINIKGSYVGELRELKELVELISINRKKKTSLKSLALGHSVQINNYILIKLPRLLKKI